MKIAKRMQGLKPSVGFELLKIGKQMQAKGEDVVSLAIGELKWNTYKPLREAGKRAIDEGYTKYCPASGRENLRQKLSAEASQQMQIDFQAENVFVGNGCKYVLFSAFQSLCEKEDEVLLPAPYWLSYPPLIQLSGAKIKTVQTKEENHFKITAKQLEENISSKTKVFLLNSPNNPTSSVYSEKELAEIGKVLSQHPNVVTIVDAIYDKIVFSNQRAPHLLSVCPHLKNQVLACNGASKNYLMTGWRLGWLIGPKNFVKTISAFESQSAGCANSIAQKAFEDAFELCEEDLKNMVRDLKKLRDILTEGLKKIHGLKLFPSEGAFYLWVGVSHFLGKKHQGQLINSSEELMKRLLEQKKLLCICGEEFGMPGYLRLSYVTDQEEMKKAVVRLQEFFSELT